MTLDIDFSLVRSFFHISPEGADKPIYEIPATDLGNKERALDTLIMVRELGHATSFEMPVSFAGLTLFNLCATHLIFIAQYNRMLDLSLHNLTFQLERHPNYTNLGYRINELRWIDVPKVDRVNFLVRKYTEYIRENITPIVESLSSAGGLKANLIWNQYGARIAFIQYYMSENDSRGFVLQRLDEQCKLLTQLSAPHLFNRRHNPFVHKPKYLDSPWEPGENVIMRSSCCMYYCREGGNKCYNCPKMLPEEREVQRKLIMASNS